MFGLFLLVSHAPYVVQILESKLRKNLQKHVEIF